MTETPTPGSEPLYVAYAYDPASKQQLLTVDFAAFARELDHYIAWYNAERPHSRFGARTPDEIYFGKFPACRRPRHEPRVCWPRRSPCAQPHALIRGRPGAVVELIVEHRGARNHLPVISLKRVA